MDPANNNVAGEQTGEQVEERERETVIPPQIPPQRIDRVLGTVPYVRWDAAGMSNRRVKKIEKSSKDGQYIVRVKYADGKKSCCQLPDEKVLHIMYLFGAIDEAGIMDHQRMYALIDCAVKGNCSISWITFHFFAAATNYSLTNTVDGLVRNSRSAKNVLLAIEWMEKNCDLMTVALCAAQRRKLWLPDLPWEMIMDYLGGRYNRILQQVPFPLTSDYLRRLKETAKLVLKACGSN